jgi:hypothetical protein
MRFPKPTDLPLHHTPSATWSRAWDQLLSANGTEKKFNREQGLRDCINYLRANAAEVSHIRDRVVLDFDQGPGELLEVGRHLGHIAFGIMAPVTEQDPYASAVSCCMSDRAWKYRISGCQLT